MPPSLEAIDDLFPEKLVQEEFNLAQWIANQNHAAHPAMKCVGCHEAEEMLQGLLCKDCVGNGYQLYVQMHERLTTADEAHARAVIAFADLVAAASDADQARYEVFLTKRLECLGTAKETAFMVRYQEALVRKDGLGVILRAEQERNAASEAMGAAWQREGELSYQLSMIKGSQGWRLPDALNERIQNTGR